MPENRIIKYCYINNNMSIEGIEHVFKYISAFANCRFIEDRQNPDIWRGEDDDYPGSTKLIISKHGNPEQPSLFGDEPDGKRIFIRNDPVEKVFNKISLKVVTGPYGTDDLRPLNDPDESLSGIIRSFYTHMQSAGLIDSDSDGVSFWPGGSPFAVALTHDVDMVLRSVKGSVRLLFKKDVQGGTKGLIDSILSSVGLTKNPYDRIPDWLKLEREFGIKSTFFMFPGNRAHNNDPKYNLNDLDKTISLIKRHGYDLGLHTGIECYKGDRIAESREFLSQFADIPIKGIRPHYLSASFPEYWGAAADSGFDYSSSLGFDNDIGFFDGVDLPFIPFDIERNEAINIVEIPIAIMDCGLLGDRGEKINAANDNGKKLITRTKESGGILVFDWHQRIMYQHDYPGWVDILRDLLRYAHEEGACFITLEKAAGLLKDKMSGN